MTVLLGFLSIALAEIRPKFYFQSEDYAHSKFGETPANHFKTFEKHAPITNVLAHDDSCYDGLYTLITPRGPSVTFAGPTILDQQGMLIWTDSGYFEPYNLDVQTFKGEQYLTFWGGNDGVVGHGSGQYFMVS